MDNETCHFRQRSDICVYKYIEYEYIYVYVYVYTHFSFDFLGPYMLLSDYMPTKYMVYWPRFWQGENGQLPWITNIAASPSICGMVGEEKSALSPKVSGT